MNKTKIALRYNNAVVLYHGTEDNANAVASFFAELMQLGFVPSKELTETLRSNSIETISAVFKDVISVLREAKGADVEYVPFYPNFPKQVMEASEAELFWNAITHYWTFGQWRPDYVKLPRPVDLEDVQFKEIGVISEVTFRSIFTRLVGSNDSISEADKKVVGWFLKNYSDDELAYPDEIPFKENACYVAGQLLAKGRDISGLVKTATDVLRIVTALNGGDISLAENTKFASLPRETRRLLVAQLERVIREEDINRHRNKWVRLFHNLHVGDYSEKVYGTAKKVRNNERIVTFNSAVEASLAQKDVIAAAALLAQRPGEFARRIDHLLRLAPRKAPATIANFLTVVDNVPTRVLLQLLGNLKVRRQDASKRIVFPKGNVQRGQVIRGEVKKLSLNSVNTLTTGIKSALLARFGGLEPLGNVFVDPELMDCPVPSQQRSASEGLLQVGRGTRLPIGDKGTLRFFIYWVGQDIDLSATLHDEHFNTIEHVSYTQLRSDTYQAYHSGDITSARNGACEFIDITIDGAAKSGARYVAMNVLVFSGPSFAEHEKVYAGWMTRNRPQSNEIFDPKTVVQKVDLASNATNAVPVIFDLVERKAIWTDLTTPRRTYYWGNNVESNRASIQETMEAIVTMANKVTLYELFELHARARGEIVESKEDADVVFSPYEGITPYNIDVINSEYLV